jgi:hypothetical protein
LPPVAPAGLHKGSILGGPRVGRIPRFLRGFYPPDHGDETMAVPWLVFVCCAAK